MIEFMSLHSSGMFFGAAQKEGKTGKKVMTLKVKIVMFAFYNVIVITFASATGQWLAALYFVISLGQQGDLLPLYRRRTTAGSGGRWHRYAIVIHMPRDFRCAVSCQLVSLSTRGHIGQTFRAKRPLHGYTANSHGLGHDLFFADDAVRTHDLSQVGEGLPRGTFHRQRRSRCVDPRPV